MEEIQKKTKPAEKSTGKEARHFFISILPALTAAGLMSLILLIEWAGGISLASMGLRPREIRGIPGILFFPFLHGSLLHLGSNVFPFVLLSTLIYNILKPIFWRVWLFTFLLSGIWTWCFARLGLVIGASAWVYALLGFMLVAGFARLGRKVMILAGGLAFLYGGMVVGLLPVKQGISWEGHLMGLISGFTAAWYWRREIRVHEKGSVNHPLHPEEEPPYPYWLHREAHFIDENRKVIHPDDISWENGRPLIQKIEESTNQESTDAEFPKNPVIISGPWTITFSFPSNPKAPGSQ